jgi:monoamine oxidase
MAKNPVLSALLRLVRQYRAETSGDQKGEGGLGRRDFLKGAAGGLGALAAFSALPEGAHAQQRRRNTVAPRRPAQPVRVGIIGAGLAGLVAADELVRKGAEVRLFDARTRIGGRVRTLLDGLGHGLPAELGGEFINSEHRTMRALTDRFKLPLLDTLAGDEAKFQPVLVVDGKRLEVSKVVADLAAFLKQVSDDVKLSIEASGAALRAESELPVRLLELDRMSMAQYFDEKSCPQPLRTILESAYTAEFGRETADQSAINFLIMFSEMESEEEPDFLGGSDERFKLIGGNELLAKALGAAITQAQPEASPRLEHILKSVRPASVDPAKGLIVTLEQVHGGTVEFTFDRVILALPFTALRSVDLAELELSPKKRSVIEGLGYGLSGKLILGFADRLWRQDGLNGASYSDAAFQSSWDTSRARAGTAGALTLYCGGEKALADLGKGTTEEVEQRWRPELLKVFSRLDGQEPHRLLRAHWPSEAHVRVGYSSFGPGQWTRFNGLEGKAELDGRLIFAGEHTSLEAGGYMEGAAESGKRAALEALKAL